MTANKEHLDLFQSSLIAEKEINGVIFRLYENRVFYVTIPRFEKIGKIIIDQGYAFLDEHGGGKYHNVYQFESFSDVEPETREWAADSNGNLYTHSDAIVIGSLSQKIITDFYLRFNRPSHPTKIFYSIDKAAEWTFDQIGKFKEED
jgi:hypothetical protein